MDTCGMRLREAAKVEVQVKAEKFTAQAHTADVSERAALWPKMVEIYAPSRRIAPRRAESR